MTMTIEEKAEAYDKALERMKSWMRGEHPECFTEAQKAAEFIFPELKESEDERIRKVLIEFFSMGAKNNLHTDGIADKDIIAWLEKQGEKKPSDKVKPKFEVGDWLVHNERKHIIKVVNPTPMVYEVVNVLGYHHTITDSAIENNYHLWSIADAKDGDVLSNGKMIVIFKHFEEPSYRQHIVAYIGLDRGGDIQITDDTWRLGIDKAKPATKEQRELLFQKMHEAGYIFDFEKKELKIVDWSKHIKYNPNPPSIVKESAWSEEEPQLKEGNFYECIKSYHYLGGGQYWFDKGKVYFCERDGYLRSDPNNNIYVYDCKNWQSYFRPYTKKTAEWSEEDEKMMAAIEHHLNNCGASITSILWLKSLRPQNHWKPSDEQIKVCKEVYADILSAKGFALGTVNSELNRLEEELKKLKEE